MTEFIAAHSKKNTSVVAQGKYLLSEKQTVRDAFDMAKSLGLTPHHFHVSFWLSSDPDRGISASLKEIFQRDPRVALVIEELPSPHTNNRTSRSMENLLFTLADQKEITVGKEIVDISQATVFWKQNGPTDQSVFLARRYRKLDF